ncbi:MAG: hypothetical protein K2X29_04945 [Candidatus Obscuribacterales bacterium]|nr:hypothetical protein [Candidatus Obscuribacterales bacterium]
MRNPRELSPADVADDLAKLHNLPTSDKTAHEALLQEVNGYFQYNINRLKQEAQIPHSDGRPHDLRGDVIALFKNVENMTSFDQRPGEKAPYHMDSVDDGKNIPICFHYFDNGSKLSFSIRTDGSYNPDFMYQQSKKYNVPFPQPYKTWSQYWGGSDTPNVQPYNPGGRTKGKYEF